MSWGVVATVDEPATLIAAFAGWHIAQGAAEVHLFFDRPNPEAEALVAPLPGVRVTLCDDAYWAARGEDDRRARQTGRQMLNARFAAETAGVDWLLHCDADEFVADGAVLARALATAKTDVVRLRVLERVDRVGVDSQGIFDGLFRHRDLSFEWRGEANYGRWAKFLIYGMAGHYVGKIAIRTGSGLRHAVHTVAGKGRGEAPEIKLNGALLHFDGLTRRHYFAKMLRRAQMDHFMKGAGPDGKPRQKQIKYLRNHADGRAQIQAFYDGVKSVNGAQVLALTEQEQFFDLGFDPSAALRDVGLDLDLSRAGFDAALPDHLREVFEAYPILLET